MSRPDNDYPAVMRFLYICVLCVFALLIGVVVWMCRKPGKQERVTYSQSIPR